MSFTSVARLLAFAAVAFGLMNLTLGLAAALADNPQTFAGYLGSRTSGEKIDGALWMIGSGIVLGVLTDISRSLRQ